MHAGTDRLGGMFLILEILKTSSWLLCVNEEKQNVNNHKEINQNYYRFK